MTVRVLVDDDAAGPVRVVDRTVEFASFTDGRILDGDRFCVTLTAGVWVSHFGTPYDGARVLDDYKAGRLRKRFTAVSAEVQEPVDRELYDWMLKQLGGLDRARLAMEFAAFRDGTTLVEPDGGWLNVMLVCGHWIRPNSEQIDTAHVRFSFLQGTLVKQDV